MRDKRRYGSADLFPTDHPIESAQMIGRADDVDRVATALLGGGNIVLAGPRRTGKTTVAQAALEACVQEGAYVAAVDVFDLLDSIELAQALTVGLLKNRPTLKRAIDDARRTGKNVVDALRPAAVLRAHEDLGDDIEIALEFGRPDPDSAQARLRVALDLARRLAERDERRVVVFFDEF